MENKVMPTLCTDEQCTGCMACANACGRQAITFKVNDEGFYRPQINTDSCVSCMSCEKVCPILSPAKAFHSTMGKVFAAWHKDTEVRKESSSGGAFSALAETIIEQNGIVVGAAYTDELNVQHICVTDKAGLARLRLSKYVQSEIGFVYQTICEYLKQGKRVLFCGTPCQVAGLRALFPKEERPVCVDFICHGVPSPLILQRYLAWLTPQTGEIVHINFRGKDKGWYDALRVVALKDGKKVLLKGKKDAFWVGFNNNNNMQSSCYQCRFVGMERLADITIADFWGVGKQIPFGYKNEIEKGVSMVLANNGRGLKLVEDSEDKMILIPRALDEVFLRNQTMVVPCKRPKSRDTFYRDLKRLSFDEMIIRYLTPNNKTKLVKLWREYLPASLIAIIRIRDQK
ncbi:Coenzyme F420 hydrogenase/dehydrogenase, beta subunit C-terminal domain [Parabacteroides distasonis]|nr:Coenzyme F420 hydrogenase/dehydrogenase, beta subunit C-terminal domain [Parabacteroides distasonis]